MTIREGKLVFLGKFEKKRRRREKREKEIEREEKLVTEKDFKRKSMEDSKFEKKVKVCDFSSLSRSLCEIFLVLFKFDFSPFLPNFWLKFRFRFKPEFQKYIFLILYQ